MVGMVGKRYERNKGHQNKVRNYTQHGGSESQQTDPKKGTKEAFVQESNVTHNAPFFSQEPVGLDDWQLARRWQDRD